MSFIQKCVGVTATCSIGGNTDSSDSIEEVNLTHSMLGMNTQIKTRLRLLLLSQSICMPYIINFTSNNCILTVFN